MNKRRFKHLALLMLAVLPLIASAQRGTVSYTATYDIGKLSLGTTARDGSTYSTVGYDGLYNSVEPGTVSLPIDYIRFSVPSNATNFSVTATATVASTVELDYSVDICPPNADNAVRHDDSDRPSRMAWYVDEGLLAGENHIVTVAVMPVTSETGHVLRVNGAVNVTLSYDLSETPRLTPIIRRGAFLRAKGQNRTQGMVVNPGDVAANAASTRMGVNRDDELTDPETYLIVTTEDMVHPLRRLAALKRQKGIPVKVVTMTEVINDPVASQGDIFVWGGDPYVEYTDDAGKLRQYLKNKYSNCGTEFVLLAGSEVPNRGSTDMYFSELDASWSYSFGNLNEGELFVGRLLGSEVQQFVNYVDKLFRYELNPGNGDYSYLKRSLFLESNEYEGLAQRHMEDIYDTCPDTVLIAENFDNDYPTGNAVLDSIATSHYGFMFWYNAGNPSHIKLCGPDQFGASHYLWALSDEKDDPNVTDTEIGNGLDRMNNREYPMICFSASGSTIPYDSGNVVNLGESFTMGKDYGGPVFMGLSHNYNADITTEMDLFANAICSDMCTSLSLGEIYCLSKSLISGLQSDLVVCGHNYLGDPALNSWSYNPQTYSGIIVTRSNSSITVTGLANSTVVAYYSNDGTTGTVSASSSTVTLNGVSPNSTIMLYNHNYIPYIAPLVLQDVTLDNSQYVIASSVLVGNKVDNGRSFGQVTVPSNTEYEIEATGEVKIAGGFKVEKGATFSIIPASYK